MYRREITSGIHYLDDFHFSERQTQVSAQRTLVFARATAAGFQLPQKKLKGPSSCLEFLGLQLKSDAGTICLPQAKLQQLCRMVSDWLGRRSCTKRELLSLIGTLQHAASVAKAGRCFIRRLIDLSCRVKRQHYWVRLTADELADLL